MDARKNGWFGLAGLLALAWVGLGVAGSPYALLPGLLAAVALAAGTAQRSSRWGVVAGSAVGLGAATYLFQQKLAQHAGPSICNIDEVFNCDLVNSSTYSVVAGVPIALAGAAYYGGMLVAGGLGARDEASELRFARLSVVTGLIGSAYSVFLAWASTQIGAFCALCITMYLVNVLILAAGLSELRARGQSPLQGLDAAAGGREAMLFAIVFAVVVVMGKQAYDEANPLTATPITHAGEPVGSGGGAAALTMLYRAPAGTVTIDGDEPMIGPADAKYQVVEFADFACPHCRDAKGQLEEIVKARGDVSVRFKYFALSGSCNPALPDDKGEGKARCDAALAAECAHRQGRFWEMAGQLFTNQGYFGADQLEFMATKVGLDLAAWKACVADPATLDRIKRSGQAGDQAGVQGTPALFVKGLREGEFVEVVLGPPAVLKLIESHADGQALAPGAARTP